MDRIEQLMKDAKPRVEASGTAPGSGSARSIVYSTDPDVVSMTRHTPTRHTPARRTSARRRSVQAAAATLLAAAAIAGAVVVGGNLMPQPEAGPAQSGIPTPAFSRQYRAGFSGEFHRGRDALTHPRGYLSCNLVYWGRRLHDSERGPATQ